MTKKKMKEILEQELYVNEFLYRVKELQGNKEQAMKFKEWAYCTGDIADSLKLLTSEEIWAIKFRAEKHATQHIKNIKFLEEHRPELLEEEA